MHTATSQPKRIAQYEVVETIALWGKVRVYRAFDPAAQRNVALKVISKAPKDESAEIIAQFQKQAQLSVGLKHPAIVEVYEYGEDSDLAFLASEFVEGCSLKPQLRVPIADAGSLMVQLLKALEYAHSRGVMHLHITPSNLVLSSKGELKLAGLGALYSEPSASGYRSPEQIMGSATDRRTDLFAAGIFFYELLTGTSPFPGPPENFAERVCHDQEIPASRANSRVPAVFDAVCAKALAKGPDDRYPSAQDFCDDLCAAYQTAFSARPRELVSNETAVSAFLSSLRADSKKSRSAQSRPKPEGKTPSIVSSSPWAVETLRTVERQLAAFIGPLARVVVKEAASKTADLNELYELAAESLGSPEEQKAFLARQPAGASSETKGELSRRPRSEGTESETATYIRPHPVASLSDSRPVKATPSPGKRFDLKPAVPAEKPHVVLSQSPVTGGTAALPANVKPVKNVNVERKPELKMAVRPEAAAPIESEVDVVARLEDLLGKQPENLAGYLAESPPQVEQVIHAFVATVEALVRLYAANGKSEGLTPQNIIFDRMGNASIQVSSTTSIQGTTLGGVTGSPRYSAPEIFADKGLAADVPVVTADIYSLGFMFYEILLGRQLFRTIFTSARTDLDWLRWHGDPKKKAPPLKSRLPDHPAALSELLESMMEKDAGKRAKDLASILSRLRTVGQQATRTIISRKPAASPQTSVQVQAQPRPRQVAAVRRAGAKTKKMTVILAIVLLLGIVALVVLQAPGLYRRFLAPSSHSGQTSSPATSDGHP
jgi:serine/threonine-protein kinase